MDWIFRVRVQHVGEVLGIDLVPGKHKNGPEHTAERDRHHQHQNRAETRRTGFAMAKVMANTDRDCVAEAIHEASDDEEYIEHSIVCRDLGGTQPRREARNDDEHALLRTRGGSCRAEDERDERDERQVRSASRAAESMRGIARLRNWRNLAQEYASSL